MSPLLRRLYGALLRRHPANRLRVRGRGNHIAWSDAQLRGCTVEVFGDHNRIEFEPGVRLWNAKLQLHGDHLALRVGGDAQLRGPRIVLNDPGSHVTVGPGTSMTRPVIVAQGGAGIHIGADCMIAYGADLRCSDGHGLRDPATGELLNPPADVVVGDHVWLGVHCQVLKGVVIGPGAVVAARAVVTRDVPPAALVGGNPARLLRPAVVWERPRPRIGDVEPE